MNPHPLWGVALCAWLALTGGTAKGGTSGEQLAEGAGRSLNGTSAPGLILKTIDGETIDLGALYGKQAVYLKFWATWCVPCRQQMPHFEHVYETAGSDLAVIAINVGFNDSIDEVRLYRKKLGIKMPIVFDDGQAGAALHLRVTPQHIVIGRDGRIQYVGHLADARLDEALAAARAPRSASVSTAAAGAINLASIVHYQVGDPVRPQAVQTLDGQTFQFQDPKSKRPTVLVFLSPWCESYLAASRPAVAANCRAARTQVTALAHDNRIRWLGVASGLWATREDLNDYRTSYKVRFPLTLDESGALFHKFGVSNTPTLIVVGTDGRLFRRVESTDARNLDQALLGL